jgi:hypothetical protein
MPVAAPDLMFGGVVVVTLAAVFGLAPQLFTCCRRCVGGTSSEVHRMVVTPAAECWLWVPITLLLQAEPVSGGVLIMLAVVLWMKLVSFHHCCADLRTARRRGELRPGGWV